MVPGVWSAHKANSYLEKFGSDLSEHNFLLFSIHQTLQF